MVDQINARSTPAIVPVTTPARVSAPQKVAAATPSAAQTAAAAPSLARTMAASPPVDTDRVARIRDAVAQGKFPLVPSTVADALIALRYDWMSNDKA